MSALLSSLPVSTGAWQPSPGCVTEAPRKMAVWRLRGMTPPSTHWIRWDLWSSLGGKQILLSSVPATGSLWWWSMKGSEVSGGSAVGCCWTWKMGVVVPVVGSMTLASDVAPPNWPCDLRLRSRTVVSLCQEPGDSGQSSLRSHKPSSRHSDLTESSQRPF